jgi:hypothetical protein
MVPAVWAGLAVILWVMTWLERRLITQPPVEAELPPPAASETRFTDARPARSRLGRGQFAAELDHGTVQRSLTTAEGPQGGD